jgi:hypothetical protein
MRGQLPRAVQVILFLVVSRYGMCLHICSLFSLL